MGDVVPMIKPSQKRVIERALDAACNGPDAARNERIMGRANQRDTADARELERILAMTEEELVESMGGREEYERAAQEARDVFERAVAEAERRVGKKFGPMKI